MHIQKIILSEAEVKQAVGEWLARRGITIPVAEFERSYKGDNCYNIELEQPKEPEPAPTKVAFETTDRPAPGIEPGPAYGSTT